MISAYRNPKPYSKNNPNESPISGILPDTILLLVENRPIIFYSYGHYGYSWALVTKIDNNIQAFSGRTFYSGDKLLTEPSKLNQFDSTDFFSANEALISWGFDSIDSEGLKMRSIKREHYVSVNENLSVINTDGVCVFDSDDAQAFSGPDSLEFNKKFHKLCLQMRWLSEPEIRPFIPKSAIF